jgi:MTH538 TIR-like domain (DUF1863)
VQQILQMGAIEGQQIMPAQDWEKVKLRGDEAVRRWIDGQMAYKVAVIVLIGSETASREFVKYEINRAWQLKKPLLGIRIHGLKDLDGKTSTYGKNPFEQFSFSDGTGSYADYVRVHDPAGGTSLEVYATIKTNLAAWVLGGYKRP